MEVWMAYRHQVGLTIQHAARNGIVTNWLDCTAKTNCRPALRYWCSIVRRWWSTGPRLASPGFWCGDTYCVGTTPVRPPGHRKELRWQRSLAWPCRWVVHSGAIPKKRTTRKEVCAVVVFFYIWSAVVPMLRFVLHCIMIGVWWTMDVFASLAVPGRLCRVRKWSQVGFREWRPGCQEDKGETVSWWVINTTATVAIVFLLLHITA